MISPATLCDTFTLLQEQPFNPDEPFNNGSSFNHDDPFAPESYAETPANYIIEKVLTKVRLSESSGDRAVDARGDSTSRVAILFFFIGISRSDGSLDLPEIKAGDKLISGEHEYVSTYDITTLLGDDTHTVADDNELLAMFNEATNERIWTVKGVKKLKAKSRLHHMEVSLV